MPRPNSEVYSATNCTRSAATSLEHIPVPDVAEETFKLKMTAAVEQSTMDLSLTSSTSSATAEYNATIVE